MRDQTQPCQDSVSGFGPHTASIGNTGLASPVRLYHFRRIAQSGGQPQLRPRYGGSGPTAVSRGLDSMHFSLVTCLTPNRIKTNVFERDENYVAALRDIRQRWTSTQMLCNMLWNTASLILRPDAVAGGQAANILPALRDLGFVPIAARSVRLSLDQTRELWRYQANVSTRERLRLLDLIMTSAPSLYILFRDATERVSAPATVHLTYLKGTAIVENRRKWHLRTMAGPKVANIVSYVHVSDDPADMVREIALLFPRRQWLDLMNEAEQATDRTEKVRSLLAALQADGPKDLLYRDNAR